MRATITGCNAVSAKDTNDDSASTVFEEQEQKIAALQTDLDDNRAWMQTELQAELDDTAVEDARKDTLLQASEVLAESDLADMLVGWSRGTVTPTAIDELPTDFEDWLTKAGTSSVGAEAGPKKRPDRRRREQQRTRAKKTTAAISAARAAIASAVAAEAHALKMETATAAGAASAASQPFSELSPQAQQQIEDVFKRYDADGDESIQLDELRTMMGELGGLFGFSEQVDASKLMSLLDADGGGDISWEEYSHACAVWLTEFKQADTLGAGGAASPYAPNATHPYANGAAAKPVGYTRFGSIPPDFDSRVVENLIAKRLKARLNRQFSEADRLQKQIQRLGIKLDDRRRTWSLLKGWKAMQRLEAERVHAASKVARAVRGSRDPALVGIASELDKLRSPKRRQRGGALMDDARATRKTRE